MRHTRLAFGVLGLLCVAAVGPCSSSTWEDLVGAFTSLVSGNSQSATAGHALTQPLVVKVTADQAGAITVRGIAVTWSIGSGGGSLSRTVDTTDADGRSSVTWILGPTVGQQSALATVDGVSGSPVTFTATAAAPSATQMALVSGNSQTANVGTALASPLVVKVGDASNAGVAGITVNWAVTSGGGAVWAGTSVTNASGNAQVNWTLGPTVGTQTATATVSGLTGSPVTFSATGTAVPPAATQMALVSGNNQTGTVGTALASPLVVKVGDASNAGVAGVTVSWAVTAGGGAVSAATSVTNASGQAQINWTLGATVGAQAATATVSGMTGSPVTFTATAAAPLATQLALVSGNNQTGAVNAALAAPLVVKVGDASNAGVAGVTVTWAVTLGGGTVSAATSVTNASGQAQINWTLGATVGAQAARASVAGLTGSPVTFAATGTAVSPAATQMALVSGNNQTGTVGTALASPLVVKVADASNAGVAGVTVTWSVTSGGGQVSAGTSGTNAAGNAQVNWTLGATVGAQTATATVSGLTGSPVVFSATGTAAAAGTTYYISPSGSDGANGLSRSTPWRTFSFALNRVQPGDVLIVLDGTYTQSIVTTRSGTSASPIVIRADNDGGAIIDGGWSRVPVEIGHDYVHVEGFTAKRGLENNIVIGGSHNRVSRVGAMSVTNSAYAFNIGLGGTDNLLEDVFVWGGFRTGIEVFSRGNTIRRCVVKMDALAPGDGSSRYPLGIRFYNNTGQAGGVVENCIVLDFSVTANFSYPGAAYKIRSFDPSDVSHYYGSIALNMRSSTGIHGWWMEGRNHTLTDCVAWNGADVAYISEGAYILDNSVVATNVTGYGWGAFTDGSNANIRFVNEKNGNSGMTYITRPDASGRGATIERRYVNGVLTNDPLWPWPYEARIRSEICQYEIASGYFAAADPNRGFCASGKTLTRYIWELLGNPCPAGICS